MDKNRRFTVVHTLKLLMYACTMLVNHIGRAAAAREVFS